MYQLNNHDAFVKGIWCYIQLWDKYDSDLWFIKLYTQKTGNAAVNMSVGRIVGLKCFLFYGNLSINNASNHAEQMLLTDQQLLQFRNKLEY